MKKQRIFGGFLILLGLILILNSISGITGLVIVEEISKEIGSILGIIFIIAGALIFSSNLREIGESALENIIGLVKGINPVTKSETTSPLYKSVTSKNIDEVFQTPLEKKFGEGVMGAKAIVYKSYDGSYHTAFLTEAIDTHHRHAAATVARLIDGKKFDDPTYLDKKADKLYEGDSAQSCELLGQCAGFELQYDKNLNKIIGIQQDSWLTKEQKRCGRQINQRVQEDMILELLSNINQKYLTEGLKNLEQEDIERLYSGKRVA